MNGDEHISSFEMGLWHIHQDIIFRWGVYTLFRWSRPDCRPGTQMPGLVFWMIPRHCDSALEIYNWLEAELKDHKEDPITLKEFDHTYPGQGVVIHICEFAGVGPYVPLEQRKQMAEQMTKSFMKLLKNGTKKETEGEDLPAG